MTQSEESLGCTNGRVSSTTEDAFTPSKWPSSRSPGVDLETELPSPPVLLSLSLFSSSLPECCFESCCTLCSLFSCTAASISRDSSSSTLLWVCFCCCCCCCLARFLLFFFLESFFFLEAVPAGARAVSPPPLCSFDVVETNASMERSASRRRCSHSRINVPTAIIPALFRGFPRKGIAQSTAVSPFSFRRETSAPASRRTSTHRPLPRRAATCSSVSPATPRLLFSILTTPVYRVLKLRIIC
mmetsp:Transcript_21276/g.39590  ORF Transcript_21276/g.39590 Transcript_21276/m.39590 type:complete len:243 (-) Transcript_21276:592-1320(-)